MKASKIKMLRIIMLSMLFAGLIRFSNACDEDLYQIFSSFIENLYFNTQTANRGSAICVYGKDDISSALVSSRRIIISLNENVTLRKDNYKDCRIIYVAKNKEKIVKSFVGTLNKSGVPTVAVFKSFIDKGGMIFIDIGRRDFELTINSKLFKSSGVKFDSSITGLIINNK